MRREIMHDDSKSKKRQSLKSNLIQQSYTLRVRATPYCCTREAVGDETRHADHSSLTTFTSELTSVPSRRNKISNMGTIANKPRYCIQLAIFVVRGFTRGKMCTTDVQLCSEAEIGYGVVSLILKRSCYVAAL